jgi:hypothetical protein
VWRVRWAEILAGLLLLTGCNSLELQKSISMEAVYPSAHEAQVTIHYTVPPPPPGKIYVLWILNPAQHEAVSAGPVPGGRDQTARATVNFEATGAVVSIEDRPNPDHMSNTWALRVGSVLPETPTPSVVGSPGAPTPSAGRTPSAGGTPSAATERYEARRRAVSPQ